MDWDAYRYFLAVANTGSLSAAARALKVSQPTVGRQVQVLEQALDVRLFDRHPEGYAITEAGRQILGLVRDMDGSVQAIAHRVGGENALLSGKVRIAVAEGLGTFWLPEQVGRLAGAYPDIEIELAIGASTVDLARHEADVAIRIGNPRDDTLIGRCVSTVCFGIFGAERYFQSHGEPSDLDDLASHHIIESTGAVADLPQVKALRQYRGDRKGVSLACNNLVTQFSAMTAGRGLYQAALIMTCFTAFRAALVRSGSRRGVVCAPQAARDAASAARKAAFGGAPLPRGERRDACPMPRVAPRAAPTRGANPLP